MYIIVWKHVQHCYVWDSLWYFNNRFSQLITPCFNYNIGSWCFFIFRRLISSVWLFYWPMWHIFGSRLLKVLRSFRKYIDFRLSFVVTHKKQPNGQSEHHSNSGSRHGRCGAGEPNQLRSLHTSRLVYHVQCGSQLELGSQTWYSRLLNGRKIC